MTDHLSRNSLDWPLDDVHAEVIKKGRVMVRPDVRADALIAEPTPPAHRDEELPQPRPEQQPVDHRRWRFTAHPDELVITGIVQMCPRCAARRDWMLICLGTQVFIRCRCAHQWHEPELTREDFDAMFGVVKETWPDFDTAARGHGFDGTLAGTYF